MGTSRLNNITIEYPNRKEFLSLKKEIFINEVYKIDNIEADVIIDIGAYIGLSVIYFWLQHPGSKIFAFEPTPSAFNYLRKNVATLDELEVFDVAVSKKQGFIDHYITNPESEWLSNSSNREKSWTGRESSERIVVRKISLSDLLNEHENVDILKIDVEGHEFSLIDEDLDLSGVKNILVESHPVNKSKVKKLIQILKEKGFELEFRVDGRSLTTVDYDQMFIIWGYK